MMRTKIVLNREAVAKACQYLGVKQPIQVWHPKMTTVWGRHYPYGSSTGIDRHRINIARHLDIDARNETLWHELTHATQFERYGWDQAWKMYAEGFQTIGLSISEVMRGGFEAGDDDPFYQHPMEAEALANEKLAKRYPLYDA